MEISGKVIEDQGTKLYGQKGFRKRRLIVETEGQHSQKMPIDLTGDRCDLPIEVNHDVTCHINIRSREWQRDESSDVLYFVDLEAWKVDIHSQSNPEPPREPPF